MILGVKDKNDMQIQRNTRKDQFIMKQQQGNDLQFTNSFKNGQQQYPNNNEDFYDDRGESRNGLKKTNSEIKLPKIDAERGQR